MIDNKLYKKLKNKIAKKSVDFYNSDNLFELVIAYLAAEQILKDNSFPIEEYKKYVEEEKIKNTIV